MLTKLKENMCEKGLVVEFFVLWINTIPCTECLALGDLMPHCQVVVYYRLDGLLPGR